MAKFCGKCGSPRLEGMAFCTACGAVLDPPIERAAPSPRPRRPAAAAAGRESPEPPAPRPITPRAVALRSGVGIATVLILLLMAGALGCAYFIYRNKDSVTEFVKEVEESLPGQAGPPVVMDVPPYPGATPMKGQSEVSLGLGKAKVEAYTTPDSVQQVVAYYKEKFGPGAEVSETGSFLLVQTSGSNGVIDVTIAANRDSGLTRFTVMRLVK